MKRLLTALLTISSLAGLLQSAWAGDEPVLRSQVMTLSEIVTIGDFYSNAGRLAPKPLFRSPDMGTSGNVDAEQVAQRARDAGLENAGTDGLRTVVVHRGATKYNRTQIEHLVKTAISERDAGIDIQNLEVTLLQAPDEILANPKAVEPVRVDHLNWDRNSKTFTLHATVAGEYSTRQISIRGRAAEMIEVLALAQPLKRGDILQEDDLTTIKLPKTKVSGAALFDGAGIVGKEAKINLRANQPLLRKDFQRPILISRGEKVTITFEMPGMKLTARAQAMDAGAKGDIIDIMNTQSRRIVPAIVLSRGQVRVHAANPVVASLNSETQ